MNIAIFGGTFNPPTLGHLHVACAISELNEIDEVWLTPEPNSNYKPNMMPYSDRLEMCVRMCRGVKKAEAPELREYYGPRVSTFMFLNNIRAAMPQHKFYFVIGSDNIKSALKWFRWADILGFQDFIIVPRGGVDESSLPAWYTDPRHIKLESSPIDCSSSMVRTMLKTKSIESVPVSPAVMAYLSSRPDLIEILTR